MHCNQQCYARSEDSDDVACEITSDEIYDIYVGHVFEIVKVLLDRILVRFVRTK